MACDRANTGGSTLGEGRPTGTGASFTEGLANSDAVGREFLLNTISRDRSVKIHRLPFPDGLLRAQEL